MATGKQFRAKFYDKSGIYITEMPVKMGGFRKIINGGLGDLTLGLPLRFEEAYQNASTTVFNRVEVYVDSFLVYSGFIAGVLPSISKNESKVEITCRGHASRFASLPLKNGSTVRLYTDSALGLTTSASATATSLDKILKAVVDRYQAEAVYPIINYATGTIASSSINWTYIFQAKALQYTIDKTMENAPYDWYWRVGADNIFRFLQRSATPDLNLNFKTQIKSFQDPQLIDGMVNRRYFAYNGTPAANAKVTSDTDSGNQYGDWWDFHVDGRYTSDTEVGNANQNLIDAKKSPVRHTTIVVTDNNYSRESGYGIEFIEPGLTLNITNLPEATAAVLPSLFTIVAVQYGEDMKYATLELETLTDDLARELARKERQDQSEATDNGPATYS